MSEGWKYEWMLILTEWMNVWRMKRWKNEILTEWENVWRIKEWNINWMNEGWKDGSMKY